MEVRFPLSKTVVDLINYSTGAIAAPSANPFGYISPTSSNHALEHFNNKIDAIIDGGNTAIGIESTVLDITDNNIKLLRHGGISIEEIEEVLMMHVETCSNINGKSPGQLKHHIFELYFCINNLFVLKKLIKFIIIYLRFFYEII